ncbi:unnamed protein product [Urochloa humidicola]
MTAVTGPAAGEHISTSSPITAPSSGARRAVNGATPADTARRRSRASGGRTAAPARASWAAAVPHPPRCLAIVLCTGRRGGAVPAIISVHSCMHIPSRLRFPCCQCQGAREHAKLTYHDRTGPAWTGGRRHMHCRHTMHTDCFICRDI